jgi:hypothetical protein
MSHRSNLNFWLLLATTFCLDLVVLSSRSAFSSRSRFETIFFALVFGQLSTVLIWFVFSPTQAWRRWLVAGLAVAIATWATWLVESPNQQVTEYLALTASYAMATLLALRVYKVVVTFRGRRAATEAQFSMKDLFVLTTSIAVLTALLSGTNMMRQAGTFIAFFILTNALIAIASLVFWSRSWNWFLRLAATLGLAIFAGWCLVFSRRHLAGELEVMACIQALIIFIWLTVGGIVPIQGDLAADHSILPDTTP